MPFENSAGGGATRPMDVPDSDCINHQLSLLGVIAHEDGDERLSRNYNDSEVRHSMCTEDAVEADGNISRPLDATDDCAVSPTASADTIVSSTHIPRKPSEADMLHKEGKKREDLCEKYLEPRFGLIDELASLELLSNCDVESVESKRTPTEQNEHIIDCLKQKSSIELQKFIEALINCDQQHVVNYIMNVTDSQTTADVRPLSDEEISNLSSKLPFLIETIDIDEIVDILFQVNCINERQRERISSRPTMAARNEEFVSILIKRSYADYKQFVTALVETRQCHVVDKIEDRAMMSTSFINHCRLQDLYPGLPEKPTIAESISSKRRDLQEKFMEPCYGLIPDLIAVAVLRRPESEVVTSETTPTEMNKQIIKFVLQKSSMDSEKFLLALFNGFQQHVVNFILNNADASVTDIRPLSEEERSRLRTNLPHLHKSIEPEPLIDHLFQKHCINDWQKQHLRVARGSMETNKELVNILVKRSFANFKEFINILTISGQGHVAKLIGQRGAVMPVHASISKTSNLSDEDIEKKHQIVVREIKHLLDDLNVEKLEQIGELNSLKSQGAELIEAHLGSVEMLMWCRERKGLRRLHEWLVNGRVTDIVCTLFNRLLETTANDKLPVEVKWNEDDYDNCVKYFNTWSGQSEAVKRPMTDESDGPGPDSGPKRPRREDTSRAQTTVMAETTSSEIPPIDDSEINSLPRLVREQFIQRAVVQFYSLWNKTATCPESTIYKTISDVCGYWWITIQRKGYRRRMRRILDDMCGPYRRQWIRIHRLQSATDECRVRGVAHLDGQIYVVYSQATDGIGVYMGTAPYTALQSILIPEMRYPLDVSACPKRHNLYVADWAGGGESGGRVWRVTPRQSDFVDTEICLEIDRPRKLSLHKDRLMIVSSSRLVTYDLDTFEEITRIELPEEIVEPQHAVITSTGTVLVSHGQRVDVPHRVTELSGDGKSVIRSYGDSTSGSNVGQLSWPAHLCLGVDDGDGRVILADCDNSRLLMLTAQLRLERLLVSKDEVEGELGVRFNTPRRLCYMRDSGILLVGLDFGYVDMYDIRRTNRRRSLT